MGKKSLLIEQDKPQALHYFIRSFQGATYLGFIRLIADSLYNISRAAENLNQPADINALLGCYTNPSQPPNNIFVNDILDFLNDLDKGITWKKIAPHLRQKSKNIWHQWAVEKAGHQGAKHPIENEIDSGRYFCSIK